MTWEICISYLFLALFDSNIYAGIYTQYPRNYHSKSTQLITLYSIHYVKLVVNYLAPLLSRANLKKIRSSNELNEGRVGNACTDCLKQVEVHSLFAFELTEVGVQQCFSEQISERLFCAIKYLKMLDGR